MVDYYSDLTIQASRRKYVVIAGVVAMVVVAAILRQHEDALSHRFGVLLASIAAGLFFVISFVAVRHPARIALSPQGIEMSFGGESTTYRWTDCYAFTMKDDATVEFVDRSRGMTITIMNIYDISTEQLFEELKSRSARYRQGS